MDINIPYSTYICLPEKEQRDYLFLMDFCKFNGNKLTEADYLYDNTLADRPWEKVKTLMSLYAGRKIDDIMEQIIEDIGLERIMKTEAWRVIMTLRHTIHSIENLINIENNTLVSSQPSEYTGLMEQVDFSMFNQEYVQLNDLAGGDITKFDTIRKMPYKDCFVQLLYIFKNNEFQKLVSKSIMKS